MRIFDNLAYTALIRFWDRDEILLHNPSAPFVRIVSINGLGVRASASRA
jgi:hypothetical protein